MSVATKPPPPSWPRISSVVAYDDAASAIDFLVRAFGFEIQIRIDAEGGKVEHAELVLGGGLISVGDARVRTWLRSPRALGAATQALCVYIDDVDAHCERARGAGAVILAEPETQDYGEGYWVDRSYECVDPEGHHWFFMQRLRNR